MKMQVPFYFLALWIFFTFSSLAKKFVEAKINNDASIAASTRRIADAAERANPRGKEMPLGMTAATDGSCRDSSTGLLWTPK